MLAALLAAATGCADQQKRIADLENNAKDLRAKLDDAEAARAKAEADLAQRDQDLAAKNAEIEQLKNSQGVPAGRMDELNKEIERLRAELEKKGTQDGVWQTGPGFAMTSVPTSVLFDSGSAVVKPSGKQALAQIVGDLNSKFGDKDVMILGHTDADPVKRSRKQWEDNWDLSTGRALAVARHLISKGIPSRRVIAAGAGEQRPVAGNAARTDKARNRRVEIWVYSHPATRALPPAGGESPVTPAGRTSARK